MSNLEKLTPEQLQKLHHIAEQMNTSVEKLLSEHPDPNLLIEKYESGNFRLLNE